MPPLTTFYGAVAWPPRRTAPAVALVLFLTIGLLAFASPRATAGTWNIYPTITNATGSTAATCSDSSLTGCIKVESRGIVDGSWTSSPKGGPDQIPANPGVNSISPTFSAPNFAEGADAYFSYLLPDNSRFSVVAEDDQGLTDLSNEAYPGCGAAQGQGPSGFTCLATYPAGTDSDPSSSNFRPSFAFYARGGPQPPYTAAGQVCTTTTGSALCGAGLQCAPFDASKGSWCRPEAGPPGAAQWSPTDPNNWSWLNFVNLTNTDVMVADLGMIPLSGGKMVGTGPNSTRACTMTYQGDTCALMTSGGCAASKPPCGSDAIQLTTTQGLESDGAVMVMQQAVVPEYLGVDESAELDAAIQGIIWSAFGKVYPTSGDAAEGPRITNLRASTTTTRAVKGRKAPAVRIAYRGTRQSRSVLTFARERTGVRRGGRCVAATRKTGSGGTRCRRWVDLPGVTTRAVTHAMWTPKEGKACPKTAKRGPKEGARCQQRVELRGHERHRDTAGVNHLTVTKVHGKRLAAGRYRVAVRSLLGVATGRQASTTFRIGKSS